jgi:hypothetical protein
MTLPSAASLILAAAAEVDAKPRRTQAEHAAALAEQERWLQAREMVQCAALSARIMPRQCAELRALPALPKGHMLQCAGPIRPQHCADCTRYPGYTPDGHALWLEQEKAARLQALGGRGTCIACQRQAVARIRGLCGPCRNRQIDGRLVEGPDGWVFASLKDATQGADPDEAQVREGARVVTVGEARQMAELRKNQEREEREMATRKNCTELPQDCAEAPETDKDSPEVGNAQPDPEPGAAAGQPVPEPEGETGGSEKPEADPFAGLEFEPFNARRGGEKLIAPAMSVTAGGDLTFNVPATKALNGLGVKRVRLFVSRCPSGGLAVGIKGVDPDEDEDGTYALSHTGGSSTGRRIACRAFSIQNRVQFSQLGAPLIWSKAQGGMWCAELKRKEA